MSKLNPRSSYEPGSPLLFAWQRAAAGLLHFSTPAWGRGISCHSYNKIHCTGLLEGRKSYLGTTELVPIPAMLSPSHQATATAEKEPGSKIQPRPAEKREMVEGPLLCSFLPGK